MSNDDAGWDDVRGPRIAPQDLETHVDWSEQIERDIRQTRFETARVANELELRIQKQEQLIEGQGRLIRFLADGLFAVIGALFGGLAAAYVNGDIYWRAGFGVFVFLLTVLGGIFLFKGLTASVLSDPLAEQQVQPNRKNIRLMFRQSLRPFFKSRDRGQRGRDWASSSAPTPRYRK
jgi:hypothetical protein